MARNVKVDRIDNDFNTVCHQTDIVNLFHNDFALVKRVIREVIIQPNHTNTDQVNIYCYEISVDKFAVTVLFKVVRQVMNTVDCDVHHIVALNKVVLVNGNADVDNFFNHFLDVIIFTAILCHNINNGNKHKPANMIAIIRFIFITTVNLSLL